ncbi:MAG: polysaccharide deacetylase family protein [Candidatus Sumerlaeaceae bacterium]
MHSSHRSRNRAIGLIVLLLTSVLPASVCAGWLKPNVQWPGYYPPYWDQREPYYRPPQRREPKPARKSKPRNTEKPKNETAKAVATTETETVQSDDSIQEVESANPLQQSRKKSSLQPRSEAPPVQPVSGDYVSMVWDDSDSLEKIAAICGTSSANVLRQNALSRAELRDGQVLQLPRPAGDAPEIAALQPERQRAREIWRGIRGQKRIALTFDAGGEDDAATDLLSYLTEAAAPATFFITGQFAAEHGKLVKQISDAGYPVHNHTWSHPEFTTIPDEKIAEELERAEWAIRDTTAKTTRPFWRPPFGDRDNRVLRAAAQAGYQSIYWTLDSLDSVGEKKDPEFIVSRILNPPKANGDADSYLDGAIILMHVGEPDTARAVPLLIKALRQRGFRLVTVEEIVKPSAPGANRQ